MLRVAAWLVLSGFKTDGWPPVPIPKASPGPNCRWSWLLPCCGNCFVGVAFFVMLATLVSLPANASSSRVSPTASHSLREFVPTNARTTLLYRTLDTCGGAAASPCSHVRPGHKIGCRIFRGGSLALSAQYLPHCLRKRDNNKQTFCPRRARPWLIARRADATLGRYGPRWSRPLHKQGTRIETRLRLLHWPVFRSLSRVVAYRCPFAWAGLYFFHFRLLLFCVCAARPGHCAPRLSFRVGCLVQQAAPLPRGRSVA